MSDATVSLFCAPDGLAIRSVRHCPTCQRRRRFAGIDQLWYGPTLTCLACGDTWSDGQRLPRPFRRAWRPASRAVAAKHWEAGVRAWSPDHMAWLHAQIAPYEPAPVGEGLTPASPLPHGREGT